MSNENWSANPEEFKTQIKQTLSELVEMGLVQIVGIDGNGEWIYSLTEEGQKHVSKDDDWRD